MNLISTFLEKFKRLAPPESVMKTAFLGAVRSVLKVEFRPDQIRVRRDIVSFEGNPLFKSELMLKKKELLAHANEELKMFSRRITDIR